MKDTETGKQLYTAKSVKSRKTYPEGTVQRETMVLWMIHWSRKS